MRAHRAFALLAALLPTPALLAQDSPAAATAPAPWIQVDLIVFRNFDAASAADERWPAQPALGYPESLRFLIDPPGGPDAGSPAAGAGAAGATGAVAPPVPFALLAPSESLLGDAAARIAGSQNYRLLTHLSWRQPAPGNAAEHVLVTGGRPWGEHRELEGYVSLSRANFVHVTTHLWLNDFAESGTGGDGVALPPLPRPPQSLPAPEVPPLAAAEPVAGEPAPVTTADAATPGQPVGVEPARAQRSVLLEASRRLAPGEVHYIDHPLFGAVLKVEPWDPDAVAAPVAGPAEAPAAAATVPPPSP